MKQLKSAGPFRSVEIAAAPRAPARFVFRCDENELVIEGRRRLETVPRMMLASIVGFLGFLVACGLPARLVGFLGIGVSAGVAFTLTRYWARTTLAIRGDECAVIYRGLFRSRRLRGPLRSLDIVGPAAFSLRREESIDITRPLYGLQLSLDGVPALVFRGVPREDLEWVMTQVHQWRDKHGSAAWKQG